MKLPPSSIILVVALFGTTSRAVDLAVQPLLTIPNGIDTGVSAEPVVGPDGLFYDLTASRRTVFRIGPNATGYSPIATIPPTIAPASNLTQGPNAALYGTCSDGTIFRVSEDGSGFAVLHTLNPNASEGQYSNSLVVGPDGYLYGTTAAGGAHGAGTLFRLDCTGKSFSVIYSFNYSSENTDRSASGPVIFGSGGTLYGTSYNGGSFGLGSVFAIQSDGSNYHILYSFGSTANDGNLPASALVLASDGALYGTTLQSAEGAGTVFRLNIDGTGYQILKTFPPSGGAYISSGLLEGADGYLYGLGRVPGTSLMAPDTIAFRLQKDGTGNQMISPLSFGGNAASGTIVQLSNGGLYLVDPNGGSAGIGALVQLDIANGKAISTYDFGRNTPTADPTALCIGPSGSLYGTTAYGTVFSVKPDGTGWTNLHFFQNDGLDGQNPSAILVGQDGRLYGITSYGGPNNAGTIFSIAPDGTGYSVLCGLGSTPYGIYPNGITQGTNGFLYVTTVQGGSAGFGTLLRIATDGSKASVLHNFLDIASDAPSPSAGVVQGTDGVLYGGASGSEIDPAPGAVFKINPDGSDFTILHQFTAGGGPSGRLIFGQDGDLYGIAATVFKIRPDGSGYSTVGAMEGTANLTQGSDGALYATGWTLDISAQLPYLGTVSRLANDGSGTVESAELSTPSLDGSLVALGDGSIIGVTDGDQGQRPATMFRVAVNASGAPVGLAILQEPASQTTDCGSSPILSVTATGSGLTFQWQLNEVNIPGGTAFTQTVQNEGSAGSATNTGSTLTLANVNPLQAGNYTVTITDASGTTITSTVATVAVSVDAQPVNISTRAFVGTGSQVLVAGFVISGTTSETVLIRGVGPTLTQYGVAGVLSNPILTLFDSTSTAIASNAGWGTAPVAGQSAVSVGLQAASPSVMSGVGAFALPLGSADSAMVVTLPPGAYTAQISGAHGITGVALVEVYVVP